MNKFQKRHHRQQSRLAAAGYIPAADCIGKEFAFGSCLYHVLWYHTDRDTFTLKILNQANARIEKDATFVRHHCTPVQVEQPKPAPSLPAGRAGVGSPRYSLFPAVTIKDKTDSGTSADCPVGDNMTQPELATVQLNTTLEVETCAAIPAVVDIETTSSITSTLAATPLSASEAQGRGAGGEVDPVHYIGQKFVWSTEDGTTFNVTVQTYNAERGQFRLYEPKGGCWYREPAFVYAHCQPAAQPVIREPLPKIEFDPRRYWNLVSLSDKRRYIADDVQATGVPQPDPLLQCECCEQHVTIIGKQVFPAKYKLKDLIMVECQNEDCIAHRRTASTESHHQICDDARCEAAGKERAS